MLAHWLRLREPADEAARADAMTRHLARRLPAGRTIRLVDLGTGTGANIRYLADRFGGEQQWLAVDRSPVLLAALHDRMASWAAARGHAYARHGARSSIRGPAVACEIETMAVDLGTLDDSTIFADADLIAASALLDLVSESWLTTLARQCRAAGAAALFAITYNGRFDCEPADPGDAVGRELMNRHQRRDKGLGGPAAGPTAAAVAERLFADVGYRTRREPSDWTLGPGDVELQRLLVEGWAEAAIEVDPARAAEISAWCARRVGHVEAGRSRIVVGHDDLAAWPPDAEARR